MCDSVNHTRFPKEDHLSDWVRWDKHGNKGDRVDYKHKCHKKTCKYNNLLWLDICICTKILNFVELQQAITEYWYCYPDVCYEPMSKGRHCCTDQEYISPA